MSQKESVAWTSALSSDKPTRYLDSYPPPTGSDTVGLRSLNHRYNFHCELARPRETPSTRPRCSRDLLDGPSIVATGLTVEVHYRDVPGGWLGLLSPAFLFCLSPMSSTRRYSDRSRCSGKFGRSKAVANPTYPSTIPHLRAAHPCLAVQVPVTFLFLHSIIDRHLRHRRPVATLTFFCYHALGAAIQRTQPHTVHTLSSSTPLLSARIPPPVYQTLDSTIYVEVQTT